MPTRIFVPITSVEEGMPMCNLGHLFNAYMSRLHTLEVAAFPQETLSQYHKLSEPISRQKPADKEKARNLRISEQEYYRLSVVNNSLHDLHSIVVGACNTIGELFSLYDGDLQRYAIQNRLRRIADYVPGADEELAEMHPNDYEDFVANWEPGEEGQPWKPIYKDDAESLRPYTLAAEIDMYFAPRQDIATIENIGATPPEQWSYFTEVVRNASATRPKLSQLGEAAGVYRENAEGTYEHQSVAQRVQNELNDELSDVRVACYFEQIMKRLQFAAGLSVFLTDAASYLELLQVLHTIRDCAGMQEPGEPFAMDGNLRTDKPK